MTQKVCSCKKTLAYEQTYLSEQSTHDPTLKRVHLTTSSKKGVLLHSDSSDTTPPFLQQHSVAVFHLPQLFEQQIASLHRKQNTQCTGERETQVQSEQLEQIYQNKVPAEEQGNHLLSSMFKFSKQQNQDTERQQDEQIRIGSKCLILATATNI